MATFSKDIPKEARHDHRRRTAHTIDAAKAEARRERLNRWFEAIVAVVLTLTAFAIYLSAFE